jgi:4-nitrophenyl phosphatase
MKHPAQAAGLIIDMDGVLWRGPQWLPGVKDFFDQQRRLDRSLMLVTNNATASAAGTASRLATIDVELQVDEVLTSSGATAQYLQEHCPEVSKIYLIGEAGLRSALTEAGFTLLDAADGAEAVVVGFDREINWYKLKEAAIAIERGARFIGTNPDPSFPVPEGLAPGNGAFIGALQLTTGVTPTIVGKPEPLLYQQAAAAMALDPAQILVIGDRLGTDILGAIRAGMDSALLLTGVTTAVQAEADEIQASWIFNDLPALTQALEHA